MTKEPVRLLEVSLVRGLTARRARKAILHPMLALRNLKFAINRTISNESHIFVMGPPRSGTTLVQSVLRAHPEIAGLDGETRFFFRRNYYSLRYNEIPHDRLEDFLRAARDSVDLFDKIARSVCANECALRFIEKTPEHILRLAFIQKHFPMAQTVFIVRDPRDGFLSAKRNPNMKASSPERYSFLWRESIRTFNKVADRRRALLVRYEDFCRNPSAELDRIMRFLGIEPTENQLDPAAYSRTSVSAKIGHQRLTSVISDATVDEWKKVMDRDLVTFFKGKLAHELAQLGYDA